MALSSIQKTGYSILFCGSMLAGWVGGPFLSDYYKSHVDAPPRSVVILDSSKLAAADAIQWHLMIAEALVDADAIGLARIAGILLTDNRADTRVWSALFGCWMKADPKKAWCFANQHREPTSDVNLPWIALEQ